ncbi:MULTISPECIES: hypothetical protein [unclassified Methanoculleus]|uniref:hypothetical protein n=1 Tax=unclassified Methanoculleus TaxID=2619537 RepID=UPI0025E88BF0|nr:MULTISPECIES: hypothetical protein [unclassified Methanoculleus]
MTLVERKVVLAIYELLDAFAGQSERARRFKMKRHPVLWKYGAVALIVLPALPAIGLYSSVVIGCLLRWNKLQLLFFVTPGWILVITFLLLVALGFIQAIF